MLSNPDHKTLVSSLQSACDLLLTSNICDTFGERYKIELPVVPANSEGYQWLLAPECLETLYV